MKNDITYGLIRHVDELGRIVVPKEIRKQLNISETDAVEINVSGRCIVIKKYQPLQTLESLCGEYLSALAKSSNVACAICSTEYVLTSRGINLSTDALLSEKVMKHIRLQDTYHYEEETPLSLFENQNFLVDALYPIGTKEKPCGAVIFLHYRNTTAVERGQAKLIADMLTELIRNTGW